MIRIGLIGKTNAGKTTFFNAATLLNAEISLYPFTTKRPNVGTAYVQTLCVCRELGVGDNPRNSACIDGWRFIPVELVDLPGLIKGSWMGKGLGTQFLSVAAQADALLHIVDASGSVDAEGKITKPGMGNPVADVYDVEEELTRWFMKIVEKSVKKIQKRQGSLDIGRALHGSLGGLRVKLGQVEGALREANLESKDVKDWNTRDIWNLARRLRELSKPTLIVANKMDLAPADRNYERLADEFGEAFVIPCSSEAELALRRAEEKGYIRYIPGEESFKVTDASKLTREQERALGYVQARVFSKWMRTGVQFALNTCVFKLLNMNSVYPVEDAVTLKDRKGNILPDVFLVTHDATVTDLARQIHTELAETIVYAVDARTGVRLPTDYTLRDRDVISIVAAAGRRGRGKRR